MNGKRLALAVLMAAAVVAAVGDPAHAAFPGAKGKVVASTAVFSSSADDDIGQGATWLASIGERPARVSLHSESFFAGAPTFSPDGRHLAYSTARPGIMVSRADGSRPRRLTRIIDVEPAWSPRGGALAYIRDAGPWGTGLYVIGAHGGGRRRLLKSPGRELAWSPSGDELAYVLSELGGVGAPLILAVGLDGRVREIGRGLHVSWSRAGWLAFRRDDGLYVARSDGSQERALAQGLPEIEPTFDLGPEYSWSPDGQRIAFTHNRRVFVANMADGEPRPVARANYKSVTFSPDGRLVAFAGRDRVLLAPANGGRTRVAFRVPSYFDPGECFDGCEEWVGDIDWQARPNSR